MSNLNNGERESALQERVNLLKESGYRSFNVVSAKKSDKWAGVKVVVKNKKGRELTGEGETMDEAYENVIELIDIAMDDKA